MLFIFILLTENFVFYSIFLYNQITWHKTYWVSIIFTELYSEYNHLHSGKNEGADKVFKCRKQYFFVTVHTENGWSVLSLVSLSNRHILRDILKLKINFYNY